MLDVGRSMFGVQTNYYFNFMKFHKRCQVSAGPPAKKMAGLIEKETLISYELFDPKIPNHKHQITNKFQITITNDQNNQEILSILIAVANRSHTNLKGSLIKPGCWAPWWRLLTPET